MRRLSIPLPSLDRWDRVGVEQEYEVHGPTGAVDFRRLLPELAASLPCLDPGDPRARRLPTGEALTADGWEAEIASPPVPLCQGFAENLVDRLSGARQELGAALEGHRAEIHGFSTHVSVSVDDAEAVRVARQWVAGPVLSVFALAEQPGSAGVFVRPRRGRLELGCDYVPEARLEDLLELVVAVTRALEARRPFEESALEVEPSREKFGFFVAAAGRAARAIGDPQVVSQWRTWAGPLHLGTCLDQPSVDLAPRVVAGSVHAQTAWLTWRHVVWRFHRADQELYAVMECGHEAVFLERLDAGHFDGVIERELRRRRRRRHLLVHADFVGPGWWHGVRPGALVPAERDSTGTPHVVDRRAVRRSGGSGFA